MRYAILALLLLGGCTMTHRVVLVYEGPDQNIEWQRQITDRVNLITGCLSEQQRACLEQTEGAK